MNVIAWWESTWHCIIIIVGACLCFHLTAFILSLIRLIRTIGAAYKTIKVLSTVSGISFHCDSYCLVCVFFISNTQKSTVFIKDHKIVPAAEPQTIAQLPLMYAFYDSNLIFISVSFLLIALLLPLPFRISTDTAHEIYFFMGKMTIKIIPY